MPFRVSAKMWGELCKLGDDAHVTLEDMRDAYAEVACIHTRLRSPRALVSGKTGSKKHTTSTTKVLFVTLARLELLTSRPLALQTVVGYYAALSHSVAFKMSYITPKI